MKTSIKCLILILIYTSPLVAEESTPYCPEGYSDTPVLRISLKPGLLEEKITNILNEASPAIAEGLSNLCFDDWYLFKDNIQNCPEHVDNTPFDYDEKSDCMIFPEVLSLDKMRDNGEIGGTWSEIKRGTSGYMRFSGMCLSNIRPMYDVKVECDGIKGGSNINACLVKASVPSLTLSTNFSIHHKDNSRYFSTNIPQAVSIDGEKPIQISFMIALLPNKEGRNSFQVIDNSVSLKVPPENLNLQIESGMQQMIDEADPNKILDIYFGDQASASSDDLVKVLADTPSARESALDSLLFQYQMSDQDFPSLQDYVKTKVPENFKEIQLDYLQKKYFGGNRQAMLAAADILRPKIVTQLTLIEVMDQLTSDNQNAVLANNAPRILKELEPTLDEVIGEGIESYLTDNKYMTKKFEFTLPILTLNDFANRDKVEKSYTNFIIELEKIKSRIKKSTKPNQLVHNLRSVRKVLRQMNAYVQSARISSDENMLALLEDIRIDLVGIRRLLTEKVYDFGFMPKTDKQRRKLNANKDYRRIAATRADLQDFNFLLEEEIKGLKGRTQAEEKKLVYQLSYTGNNKNGFQDLYFNVCNSAFADRKRQNPFENYQANFCIEKQDFIAQLDVDAINDYAKVLHKAGIYNKRCVTKAEDKICEEVTIGGRTWYELEGVPQIKQSDSGRYYVELPDIHRLGTVLGSKNLGRLMNQDTTTCKVYLGHHILSGASSFQADEVNLFNKNDIECDAELNLRTEQLLAFALPVQSAIMIIAGQTFLHNGLQEAILNSSGLRQQTASYINDQLANAIEGLKPRELIVEDGVISLAGEFSDDKEWQAGPLNAKEKACIRNKKQNPNLKDGHGRR